MAKYTGPKHKLARREGVNILEKNSQSLIRRLNIIPGLHGKHGKKKPSDYGLQLREKQKLKRIYGLLEKQFRNYIKAAQKEKGNTEEALIQSLEIRLDNIVYRFGFANSRYMARQLVGHRHVLVNGKKVNIPSYRVRENDVVALTAKASVNPNIRKILEEDRALPPFLEKKGHVGKILRLPNKDDIVNPVDYQLVIEYYSR